MTTAAALIKKRRFLPLFITQALGAYNDNLFKIAMTYVVIYGIYSNEAQEFQFSAMTSGLFILPYFLLSALAGQLADNHDKAFIIRLIKTLEVAIALVGGAGLVLESIPLMLVALLMLGIHSACFGPIKYAILPQHLEKDEVLAGTGLVEAGTYVAVLLGTVTGGWIITQQGEGAEIAAGLVLIVATLGWFAGRAVPPAPPQKEVEKVDLNIFRASYRLIYATMHIRRLFLAIISISFFWTIGAVLIIQFPPLVKNVLTGGPEVASLFLAIFSVGVAIGSVLINRLLDSKVSARFAPVSVIMMGGFVMLFFITCRNWGGLPNGELYDFMTFFSSPGAWLVLVLLLLIAISGGMFVVPLYAFLTTTVDISQTARTVAANNVVNSGCMVIGSLLAYGLSLIGVPTVDQLLLVAVMCLGSAWLGWLLHKAEDDIPAEALAGDPDEQLAAAVAREGDVPADPHQR